jgi:hypothetical protein
MGHRSAGSRRLASAVVRRAFASTLIALGVLAPCCGPAAASYGDPTALYGDEIRFDVLRDGDKVGAHVVRFARDGDSISVHASFGIAIKILGFTVYSYSYVSRSLWRGGRVIELEARVDDDGAEHRVRAGADDQGLEVSGPDGTFVAPVDILPTDHWNAAVLRSDLVLNTLTGNLNRVQIVDLGAAVVETSGGGRQARHFRYTGELEADVWYDAEGRWVKLRFKAEDGSTIDYVCRVCGREN